jgi:MFS family permease
MMLVAIVIFLVGSAACALAPNMATLIAARALQGVGGGGILPLAHIILGDMVSPRERARYQSYTSMMFMVASISGPVLGGVLTDYVHWTMIFWINLPLGLLALWMTDRALRELPRYERPHRLDMLGAALMILAALALMLAMNFGGQIRGGTHYGWGSWPILSLLAGSVALWLLFSLRVACAPEPFIPLAILRESTVAAIAVTGFFSIGVVIALSIFLPLYFELVLGFSPSGSGTALIVFLAASTLGSYIAGRLMLRFERYKWVPIGGIALGIAMLAAMAVQPASLSLFAVCVLLTIGGTGLGVMYPVTTTIVQNSVAPHQLGTATGALNFARQLGGTITVAAFGAIVLGGIDAGGHGLTLDMLRGGGSRAGADLASLFGLLFGAGAVFLALSLVAMLLVEERPLRGPRQQTGAAAAAPPSPVAAE